MAKLTPAEALKRIEEGTEVIPTDKNYKAYIGSAYDKVYFDEFSDQEKQRLIDLCNEHRVHFGYPGYFYVLPFFMRLAPVDKFKPVDES